MDKGYNKNIVQIPDLSLVMVYKISPFLQAHRGNVQKLPIKPNFQNKVLSAQKNREKDEIEKKKEKSIADSRKQQIKQKIKKRIKEQVDSLLKNSQKGKFKNLIASPVTERPRKSINIKLDSTPNKTFVIEPQTPNCITNHLIKKSILFESKPPTRHRNVKSSLQHRRNTKQTIKRQPVKQNPFSYRRSMSSDIRIKSKKTTENQIRNKSATKKKEEISILPWDIENFEEDFEL